jgi:O-acetyl-ADP-ribose deacetylase (regulator of RNase III)
VNATLAERVIAEAHTLQLVHGDLVAETTEAIVNAANAHLQHGSGVAGAILRRGGLVIQQQSDAWVRKHGPVTHARPAWTTGGQLPVKYIIHAVGPVWGKGELSTDTRAAEDEQLAAAVQGSLRVADELGLQSLALPAISTGIFGFPVKRAAQIMLDSIREYFTQNASGLKLVRLVLFDDATVAAFRAAWEQLP